MKISRSVFGSDPTCMKWLNYELTQIVLCKTCTSAHTHTHTYMDEYAHITSMLHSSIGSQVKLNNIYEQILEIQLECPCICIYTFPKHFNRFTIYIFFRKLEKLIHHSMILHFYILRKTLSYFDHDRLITH